MFYRLLAVLALTSSALAQFTVDNGTFVAFDALPDQLVEYTTGGGPTGDVLSVTTPGIPVGVAVINGEVWTIDTSETIGRVDLLSGQLAFSFNPPTVTTAEALGTFGNELLAANWIASVVDRYDTQGNLLGTITLSQTVAATGIDSDGTRLYMGDYNDGLVYVFDMSGAFQQTLDYGIAPSSLSGLAHEPKSDRLWISTGYGNDLLMEVDLAGNVLATYPAASPWVNGLSFAGSGGGPGIGSNYCTPAAANSTGVPGTIAAFGSDVATDANLGLLASNLPSGQFAYFLGSLVQGFVPNAGGSQGNLCVANPTARFNAQLGQASAGGTISIVVDTLNVPLPPTFAHTVVAGETWNFQCWYRDLNPGTTSNFTDAVSVTFQ